MKVGISATSWAAILLGLGLLGSCGGSATRAGHEPSPSESAGEAGAPGASAAPGGGADADGGSTAPAASGGRVNGDAGGSGPSAAGEGAAAAAGSGGATGGQPSLALPPSCEARAAAETETSCSLTAYCSVQSQVTRCGKLPSGRWQCSCELAHSERTFEVEGATGLQACGVATGLCGAGESAIGAESCVALNDDGSEDACRINLRCESEVEVPFAPDARAWLVRQGEAECYRSESGPALECGCTYRGVNRWHDLLAESATAACRPFVDFCMSEAEPELDGERRCLLVHQASDSDGCQREDACANPMPLAEGVELAVFETQYYSGCEPDPGGGARCFCDDPASATFVFHTDAPADAAACTVARNACADSTEISATGAVSCEPQTETSIGDVWCEAELSCQQPASFAGGAVVAEGRLLVRCARNEDGQPWQCSCASNQTTAKFPLGAADATATEACTRAPQGCLEQLDVHLGPYGELVYPPDPLSP